MADGDRVVLAADEDLAEDESQDALLAGVVELVEAVGESAEEALDRVGELEVALGVVQLGGERVELGVVLDATLLRMGGLLLTSNVGMAEAAAVV